MWVNQNNEYTSYLAGKVYVADVPAGIPAYQIWVNEDAIESYIEANTVFTRLWGVNWLQIVKDFAAQEASIRWDECDYVETKYTRPLITINQDWLENIDVDAISIISWLNSQNVAASPISITGEVIQAWAVVVWKGTVYPITNKMGDNTVVTSVVVDDNGTPLVLDTDYTLNVDTDWSVTWEIWKSYITFLTDTSWVGTGVDIDYDYTPNATKYTWVKSTVIQLPQLIVKIVWCPNADSKYNTHYLVNGSISWTITQWFVDIAEAGSPVASPISFVSNIGWYMIDKIERWVA